MEASGPSNEMPCLVGDSPAFRLLKGRLSAVAQAQRTTLVCGPTGSGKDLVARALHASSSRKHRPFVTVHCAALPETLIEAEMFGHSRGAFTGAMQSRFGLVRSAGEGTIFLDEIDSLPLGAQAKLLRFLDAGEYRAVGCDRPEHSNAWVIAATNRDLNALVRDGAFRADLMFRLSVVQLQVPGLKDRPEDVLCLADHFLAEATQGQRRFSERARAALLEHEWPGNVRELKHRVESATVFSPELIVDEVALSLRPPSPAMLTLPTPLVLASEPAGLERQLWRLVSERHLSLAQALEVCEQLLIESALRTEGGNRTRAAGRLGIHVRTLFKKLVHCSSRQATVPVETCLDGQGAVA